MNNPLDRFERARNLGNDALLRLRAEILLDHADHGRISVTAQERETLERIAAFPQPEDREFLGSFDKQLEAMGIPLNPVPEMPADVNGQCNWVCACTEERELAINAAAESFLKSAHELTAALNACRQAWSGLEEHRPSAVVGRIISDRKESLQKTSAKVRELIAELEWDGEVEGEEES
jgi:hypothetical protein